MKTKITILFLILAFILTSGFGCQEQYTSAVKDKMQPITLNYWRVGDGPDAMGDIIKAYNDLHPQISIRYKKLRLDEYEQALLEAFAQDKGPDILTLHNTWLRKYENKGFISPMPAQAEMVYMIPGTGIKKEPVPTLRTNKLLSLNDLENKFADVVYKDVVIRAMDDKKKVETDQIFGLPLGLDTMALFYNKDLLNNAGIANPPQYWNRTFQQNVKKLTKQDTRGTIIQSGAAMGGSTNIDRATDILALLMMQNGTIMMSDSGRVMFNTIPETITAKDYNPGVEALKFYSDFANPGKEVYAWNNQLENSIDAFADGKAAMMFGYSYHIPMIQAKNPKLNFNITKMPQIEGNDTSVNFANYWVESVSSKSKHKVEAWDFINYATTREDVVKKYLAAVKKPSALKNLIDNQLEDRDLGVFASQVLTAKSWYRGNNVQAAEKAMDDMIDMALTKPDDLASVINFGASRVQQTVNSGDDGN